jgi:ADP-ribose pyrophosphatase YjhB (NUDIX family)
MGAGPSSLAMSAASLPPLPAPHTRLGVGGVLVRNGKVLVNRAVYRSRFTIPSGYVDAGESLATALIREFEEETGLEVRVGRMILARHKVITPEESDVYFAFALEYRSGEAVARPPEIAEMREVPVLEALEAPWIAELSRMAIRIGSESSDGWNRSSWKGGEMPGLETEAYYPAH